MSAGLKLQSWLQARNPRERVMLLVMFVALAAFAAWYALWVPLRHMRDASQVRYDQSVRDLRQAQLASSLHAAATRDRPTLDRAAATRLILESAEAAAVPVSRQRIDGEGRLVLGVDSAAAPQLFAWLDDLHRQHGRAPAALDVVRSGAGVRAEATFEAGR